MNETGNLLVKDAMTKGLYLGLAVSGFSFLLYATDMEKGFLGFLIFTIFFVGLYLSTKNYRSQRPGELMSYGDGMSYGMMLTFFTSFIIAFYTYILYGIINPNLFAEQLVEVEKALVESGSLNDAQIDQFLAMQKENATPTLIAFSTMFQYGMFGFIGSLIVSAILKKKGDPFQDAMSELDS